MKVIGTGIMIAAIIEVLIVPFVDGLCSGAAGCIANGQGVSFFHCIALGVGLAGPAAFAVKLLEKRKKRQ
ncbi:MAG: hypothetical protein HY918_02505 [Candidatus Doudnabacteria bacterium]|nr:hypothetical protein [Candidatus Doudnabacteria bacterium]